MGKGEGERWREVLYIMEMEREEGSYPVDAAFALLMPCFYYIQDPQRKTGAKKTQRNMGKLLFVKNIELLLLSK